MQFVAEIIGAGHQVVGMTRSDNRAATLKAMGAEMHRASLDDPESVARGAVGVDAVIHTALDHDFSRHAENCEKDVRVINVIGAALGGERPLIITFGTGTGANRSDGTATEEIVNRDPAFPRSASERAAAEVVASGESVTVLRLPQVHDTERQGFVTFYIDLARRAGVCGYFRKGANRWCAGHVSDVARF